MSGRGPYVGMITHPGE